LTKEAKRIPVPRAHPRIGKKVNDKARALAAFTKSKSCSHYVYLVALAAFANSNYNGK